MPRSKKCVISAFLLACLFAPQMPLKASYAGWVSEMRKDQEAAIEKTDMEDVFTARLRDALTKKTEAHINTLKSFAKEYPESRFANDAYLVSSLMEFNGLMLGNDSNHLAAFIQNLTGFISRNYDYQLKGVTYRKMVEIVGIEEAPKYNALRIPFKYMMLYLNGRVLPKFNNMQGVIDNFTMLKDSLGESRECRGVFEYEVYPQLAEAYKKLGKLPEARAVADEALSKFPGDEWFQKFISELNRNDLKTKQKEGE